MDWTIGKLLAWAGPYLSRHAVTAPRLSAELLLARALDLTRLQLYLNYDRPLGLLELAAFKALLLRRRAHEPVAYLLGCREFYGLELAVGPGALIPRPETEHLVETGLKLLRESSSPQVLDLCTGSGAVALALAAACPQAQVWASDISPEALHYAALNAKNLQLSQRVHLRQGDLWQPWAADSRRFDLITANPPYVSQQQWRELSPEIKDFEPSLALLGGNDGLDLIKNIIEGAHAFLRPAASLLIELGAGQARAAGRLAAEAGIFQKIYTVSDLAGHERVLVCVSNNKRSWHGQTGN